MCFGLRCLLRLRPAPRRDPLHGDASIREILVNYPPGSTIVKEFLQNADDAGASVVKLCVDDRSFGTGSLAHDKLAQFQVRVPSPRSGARLCCGAGVRQSNSKTDALLAPPPRRVLRSWSTIMGCFRTRTLTRYRASATQKSAGSLLKLVRGPS